MGIASIYEYLPLNFPITPCQSTLSAIRCTSSLYLGDYLRTEKYEICLIITQISLIIAYEMQDNSVWIKEKGVEWVVGGHLPRCSGSPT